MTMPAKSESMSEKPVLLAVLSEALCRVCTQTGRSFTAREALAGAALACAALTALLWLVQRLAAAPRFGRAGQLAAAALLGAGGVRAFLQVIRLSGQFPGAGPGWPLVLAAALLALHPSLNALERCSVPLLALGALVGIWAFLGLAAQLRWQNLSLLPLRAAGAADAFRAFFLPLPDYLLLVWCAPAHAGRARRIPALYCALSAGLVLAAELLFGSAAGAAPYAAMEGIRAWGLGHFSRMDPLWTGLWLLLTFYRILLLGRGARLLAGGALRPGKEAPADEAAG